MPREGVGTCTVVVHCNKQLYSCSKCPAYYVQALQVAAIVLMYYAQCYKKLPYNIVMQSTIVVLVLKGRALYKGPGL